MIVAVVGEPGELSTYPGCRYFERWMKVVWEGMERGVFGGEELIVIEAMLGRVDLREMYLRGQRGDLLTVLAMLDFVESGDVEVFRNHSVYDSEVDALRWVPRGCVDSHRAERARTALDLAILPVWEGGFGGWRAAVPGPFEQREALGRERPVLIDLDPIPSATLVQFFFHENALQMVARVASIAERCRVACAVERFHFSEGRYPDGLEELVPGFLGALPDDLTCEGGLIGYRRAGSRYLVWSAGIDGDDDGGDSGPVGEGLNWAEFDGDWVWRYGVE